MRLIADVGGTNTRMALAEDGTVLDPSIRSFRNDTYPDFDSLLSRFLAEAGVTVDEIVVAVAGPVEPGRARLTNHDWHFDAGALASAFGAGIVVLVNDLKALGHALPALDAEGLIPVAATELGRERGSQSLVVGIGTGFNVSPVVWTGGTAHCLRAEHGHLSLPADVMAWLRDELGEGAEAFDTVESLFSGGGLGRLLAAITSRSEAPEVILEESADPRVAEALTLYAGLLGRQARNLKLAYMPDAGLYFAGSVARAVLGSPAREAFLSEYDAPLPLEFDLLTPIWIIRDDAAALKGCALLNTDQVS